MYKTIVRKYYEAADIAASAKTFKEQVQEGIEQRFAPSLLEGEVMPDFSLAQDLVVRLLEKLDTDVMEVDSSQTLELVGSAQLRDLRNEQANKLRATLRQVRLMMDSAFPPANVDAVFRVRRVSNLKPVQLQLLAQSAAAVLREAASDWERIENASSMIPAKVVASLEEESAALEALLDQISKKKRAGQEGLRGKQEKIDAVSDATQRCTEFLYGLYRLAGLDFHAKRLGPKPRIR